MKKQKIAVWVAALLGMAVSYSSVSADNSLSRLYPFERATIKYALTGLQTGTQTTYVKEWGAVQAQHVDSRISMMGYERPFNSRIISTPEWVYTIDLVTNSGMRIANPMKNVMASGERDPEEIAKQMMAAMGGVKVGKDSHAGEACTIWEIKAASTKMCLRDDNLLVYTRTDIMGQSMEINLVSLEKGRADDSNFIIPDMEYSEPPAGFQFPGAP